MNIYRSISQVSEFIVDPDGQTKNAMKIFIFIFLSGFYSEAPKMYISCNDSRCTLHKCKVCTKEGFERYETSQGPVCLRLFNQKVEPMR